MLTVEQSKELVARGFSRRNFGRLATMVAAGSALPFMNEPAMAQLSMVKGGIPADAVVATSHLQDLYDGQTVRVGFDAKKGDLTFNPG